jgi:single-stranded DNA-binding protein
MNKVFLSGQIVNDIALSLRGDSNTPYAHFELEVQEAIKDRKKVWKKISQRFDMQIWRSLARYASTEFKCGDIVLVEAILSNDRDGLSLEVKHIEKAT